MDYEIDGLSESEVIARRERGQRNDVQFRTGRSYLQILQKNAFTFINTVLFAIGIVLILMGQMGDAFVTAGLVLLNVIVGVFQKGRAKRKAVTCLGAYTQKLPVALANRGVWVLGKC